MGNNASQEEVLMEDEAEPPAPEKPTHPHQRMGSRSSLQDGQSHRGDSQDVPVTVTDKGFSIPEITIIEGQFVSFMWEDSRSKLNIVQVVHDGEKLRPVIGGYEAKAAEVKGHYDQQFNSEGEYKFAMAKTVKDSKGTISVEVVETNDHGIRCTPLSVTVKRKVDQLVEITDEGFQQTAVYIDQTHSVKWHWMDCRTPHSVQKIEYNIEKKWFVRNTELAKAPVTSDSYRETFPKPGLFFFKTESSKASTSMCVVHVREAQKEHKIEILDRSFQPMILLVEEGDRIWWSWDKYKCKKSHSVYQIEAPPIDQDDEEPYQPVEEGFRWATPSKQGLMSQEFLKPGVYYFSDQNQQEAAEYIGTIIVKPKQQEHYIELTTQKGFEQDLVKAQTGDRLWFHWDKDEASKKKLKFVIQQIDKCLTPLAKPASPIDTTTQMEDPLDGDSMGLCAEVGLATAVVPSIGVYHYRLITEEKDINTKDMNTCSVLVNAGSKNHTVHLTDSGFEPKVITVRPNDRVWWVWQGGKKPHNIIQVSHQGSHIEDGFCSGMIRDPPSAYVYQFKEAGVFYFISSSISKVFGAIVVSTQPEVHEVKIGVAVNPDPMTIKQNDIVAWTFRSTRQYDILEIQSMDQIKPDLGEELVIAKRKCLSRAIKEPGVRQFYSKSFYQFGGDKKEAPKISSVICDERYDNMVIRVTNGGFSPTFCYILKGQSVLWTWKGTDEEHNIVHVGSDETRDDPLNPVKGPKSFNSGQKVKNNSFLYTFDEPGSYSVVSRGADGYACTIYVLRSGPTVKEPIMESSNGGSIKQFDKVQLTCPTPGAKIFYTTDGSPPLLHLEAAKLFKPDKGVVMRQPGIKFVRAIAVLERSLNSSVFTSKRYLVSDEDANDRHSLSSAASAAEPKPGPSKEGAWEWWDCVPHIKACFTEPGVLEVFWNPPEEGQIPLIKGCELFLNGVTYCDMFPPTNTSISVSGLAGGRMYEVKVEAYSTNPKYKPLTSNILVIKCPKRTPDGGPVISLERTERPDALAVVWMAIDTPDFPISGYLIFLDDVQCGSRLVPSPDSDRCKVVIGGCTLRQVHRVYVKALPQDDKSPSKTQSAYVESGEMVVCVERDVDIEHAKTSNLLEVNLPLDFDQVELPPEEERMDEPEYYKEFLEIQEGSGQLPTMDEYKNDRSPEAEDIERTRYKDGVRPLRKSSAMQSGSYVNTQERDGYDQHYPSRQATPVRSGMRGSIDRHDSIISSGRQQMSRRQSVYYDHEQSSPVPPYGSRYGSPDVGQQGSQSALRRQSVYSPGPAEYGRVKGNKLSLKMMGTVVAALRPPTYDMREQHVRSHITFKMVAHAMRMFILQENILRKGICPGLYIQKFKFDWKKFKNFIKSTDAFKEPEKTTKMFEIQAPSIPKPSSGGGPPRRSSMVRLRSGGRVDQGRGYEEMEPRYPERGIMSGRRHEEYVRQQSRSMDSVSPDRDRAYPSNQYLDVDGRSRPFAHQSRSFDGVSPERIRGHSAYDDGYQQQSPRSRSQYTPRSGQQSGRDRYHIYDEGPTEHYRRQGTGRTVEFEDDAYQRDQDAFDGRDTGYWDDGDSDYYDNTPAPPHSDRSRHDPGVEFRRRRSKYQSPRSDEDGRYDRFQDSSPEDTGRSSSRRPAGPSIRGPQAHGAITMKEYNRMSEEQKEELERRKLFSTIYGDKFPKDLAMKSLQAYGPMLRNQLLSDAIAVEDQSVGTETPQRTPRLRRSTQEYDEEGIEYEKYRRGIPERRSVSESEESEGGTTDHDSEEDGSSTSESSLSRASIPVPSNHLNFDASKSFADNEKSMKRTKESRVSSRVSEHLSAKEVLVERGERQTSRPPTIITEPQPAFDRMELARRGNKTAIIQVQESVQLDEARADDMDVTERRVAVAADKTELLRMVDDGVLIKKAHEQNTLPPPAIKVSSKGKTSVKVEWLLQDDILPDYTLLLYVVNIVGQKFGEGFRNGDHSFDCNIVEADKQLRAQQHCWNVQDRQEKMIHGLMPGMTYRIFVIANYNTLRGNQPYEVQTTSSVIYYTTMGPPGAPRLRVCSVDLYEATVEWDEPAKHKDMLLKGYRLMVDNKPFRLTPPEKKSVVINKLEPGKTICVQVKAVAKQGNGIESEPSRPIYISCPRQPTPALISQETSMKTGCVLVSWKKPESHMQAPQGESICYYQIYLNGQKKDIVKPSNKSNHQGYHHYLYDLPADEAVDVGVKCVSGSMSVDPFQDQVFCRSESRMSNTLRVIAPRVPHSPNLYLESMTTKGIEVTWMTPQQLGDVKLSGYRMMKNGHLYGGLIPPYINNWTISDVTLGEAVTLQLIALTEHPIGKIESEIANRQKSEKEKSGKTSPEEHMGDRYAGCRPGRKLKMVYTGLVQPPSDVRVHQVTGHSALLGWTIDETRFHFVKPESFRVRWWPGEEPIDNIVSDETTDNRLLITSLRSDTTYTVVVDAVKTEIMKNELVDEDQEMPEEETKNNVTLTATSDYLTLKTAKPPSKPSHIGVSANTCNSLKVAWNPPREHGTSIVGIRIDAVSMSKNEPHHLSYDALPDSSSIDIEGLKEKTEYLIRVTAVTDEYFDRLPEKHKFKKARVLPRDVMVPPMESPWLPSNYIIERTAGTELPANLKVTKATTTSMTLSWISPIVYGSNRLTNIIVRWTDVKNAKKGVDEVQMSSYKTIEPKDTQTTIIDLVPGTQYKVVVEAVVSVRTSLVDTNEKDMERYRRIAHVMSRALYCRSRAPTEAPTLYITDFTQDTAQLYWEKPRLVSSIGREEDGKPKYIRRYLEGYKLEINGTTHCCLGPTRQSCSLKKCRPGKEYVVCLVALTCTDEGKKERKKKYKGFYAQTNKEELDYATLLNDEENLDPSPSDDVTMILPRIQPGYIASVKAVFTHVEDNEVNIFGEIRVEWTIQGEATLIKDFNIHYMIEDEDTVRQVRGASASARQLPIPVERLKAVYDITVEPTYYTETLPQKAQRVQIVIPGPPDAPEIFLKSVTPEEFVIEWGEPKLWGGVKVRGYQVYMNDKKAGNELSSSHRKAVIPCRPNKTYKINLVALSSKAEYEDSLKSNTVLVNTSVHSPRQARMLDEWHTDETDVPVKVAQITDTSIHLDWSRYLEVEEVAGYRIEWSSVAQPMQRSLNLERDNNSCIINNCLPGTTHFVRLIVLDDQGKELERSRQLTIQTSAPPEAPIMSIRACNFRYISVQWEKPTTYGDALVTGYKVFVNGIIIHTLNADQTSYTYTEGKWCHEYTFQVQALTAIERLHSKVSEPLTVVWPGAMSPHLHRLPTHSSSVIRVGWDDLQMSDGAKVKHFRGVCTEEATNKIVYDFPIHPESREVEFSNLKNRVYTILLEVHLYGTSDVIRSDILRVQPAPAPDPPRVTVTVVGLDERRQLEKVTCDLVNKRDRLIRKVGHKLKEIGALSHPLRAEKNREVIEGAHMLTRVEEYLEQCFIAMEHFTGQLMAHVSWQCPQSRPDLPLAGYKVLIDGKQYGSPMHDGVRSIRISLPVDQPKYRLSMVSMTDKPQATSEESNSVELLSENFRPFSFYCYHSIHQKNSKWPNTGCCKYVDSINYERQLAKKLANQGLLKKKVPPPSCSLLDIFDGEYKPFMGTHNKQFPTVVLFWTPWCLSSQGVMSNFVRFAREFSEEYNYIAVTCGVDAMGAAERKALIHQVTTNGYRADNVLWHCTSQCASSIHEATNNTIRNGIAGPHRKYDEGNYKLVDLTEILGIAGVPTLLFIHPDGYIAWHGRYSSFDYASFSAFMRHTFCEVTGSSCSVFKCDSCQNDLNIEEDTVEQVLQLVHDIPMKNVVPPRMPAEFFQNDDSQNGHENTMEQMFFKRKPSPRGRNKKKRTSQITVNSRPYSASTYVQLLKSPYMQQVVPSPKILNRLLRPNSAGGGR